MRSWVIVLSLCVGAVGAANASTLTVTSFTDINPGLPAGLGVGVSGDLRSAIKSSNAGDTIDFACAAAPCTLTLAGPLYIDHDLTIDGGTLGSIVLDGAGAYRAFWIETGTVAVSNLVIQNVSAHGGAGTSGIAGGGGGAGLGAGFLVDRYDATVDLTNVVFANAAAVGGNGGPVDLSPNATCGGGGGLEGRGGTYGAGGGVPGDANGQTGGVGWTSTVGNGQSEPMGPGGPSGPYMPQVGGGGAGCTPLAIYAGSGGFGGGGGPAFGQNSVAGSGDAGGGGGGARDTTSTQTLASAGFGGALIDGKGGDGDISGNGGGGAAAGPAVFVIQGVVSTSSVYYTAVSAAPGTGGKNNATGDATPVFNAFGTVNGSTGSGGRGDATTAVFTPSTLASATVGVAYTQASVASTFATASNVLSVTGLPPGLSFANGAITGTPTTAGSYTVALSIAVGASTLGVSLPISVGQGSQSIAFDLGTTPTSDTTFTVSATATSGLPVSFTSTTLSVCTVSGSTVTVVAQGTCTITASQAGDANWFAAPSVSANIPIGKRTQTITFASPADQTFTQGGTFAVNATSSSGLTVTFTSSTPSVCTVSGSTVTMIASGVCTLSADQAGDADYAAATTVTHDLVIAAPTQASTTLTLMAAPLAPFSGATVTLTATLSSASATGNVDFVDGADAVCTAVAVSSGVATCSAPFTAGEHTLTARYGGDANDGPAVGTLVLGVATTTATDAGVTTDAAMPFVDAAVRSNDGGNLVSEQPPKSGGCDVGGGGSPTGIGLLLAALTVVFARRRRFA